jgi:hypothetical protein
MVWWSGYSRWVWEEEDMWKINKKSIEELITVWN